MSQKLKSLQWSQSNSLGRIHAKCHLLWLLDLKLPGRITVYSGFKATWILQPGLGTFQQTLQQKELPIQKELHKIN